MTLLNKILGPFEALYNGIPSIKADLSKNWETKEVLGGARTPNQIAKAEGKGWQVAWTDWDNGIVHLKKKK